MLTALLTSNMLLASIVLVHYYAIVLHKTDFKYICCANFSTDLSQNWKCVFGANFWGAILLLVYNGLQWKSTAVPTPTVVSVQVDT